MEKTQQKITPFKILRDQSGGNLHFAVVSLRKRHLGLDKFLSQKSFFANCVRIIKVLKNATHYKSFNF